MCDHFTLGFSKALGENGKAIHFAAVYAPECSVKGINQMDPNQTIEIKMSQIEFEIAYSF